MTKSDAISKLLASFQDEPQVITPKGRTYEDYVEERKKDLLGYVIEPENVFVASACFPEYYLEMYQSNNVWAIAKWEDNWLLTLEAENEFALAFGENKNNLMMLGFSSSDALAEWLG
ncbi:hypothetical protein ABHN84_20930 [Shewanella vesiculosa]|uniref:SMI1/KNR4 family protein n=1 Tax=Shewanella vesiculosa TaxID=518738 RepID=A0ABV0FV67_9GAMM